MKLLDLLIAAALGRLRLLIAIAGFVACAGCAHTPPPVNNVLSAVVNCSLPEIHDLAVGLVPTVETIVAKRGDGWEDDLWALVRQNAEDAVACAIKHVSETAFASSKASPSDTLSDVKARRAEMWMTKRGYRFTDGP